MRENSNREFFRVAEDKVTKIGQRFNFEMVGIKIGSILHFIRDENVTCKVISKNKVEFNNEGHSISSTGLITTNRLGFNWKSVAGPLT